MRIVSGVTPSGKLHVGNYFGALQQFIRYQACGQALYFIADLHALTTLHDGALVRSRAWDVALDYLALGVDPSQAVIFRQSDVVQHAELAWILSACTPVGWLERAHGYKDKVARGLAADMGLFTYPVLMAADILLYGAEGIPVGHDQKQHLEITRAIALKFNRMYVPGFDSNDPQGRSSGHPGILKLPRSLVLEKTAVIPGLDGQKMSKSYHNTLDLFAPESCIKERIMAMGEEASPALLTLLTVMADPEEAQEIAVRWPSDPILRTASKQRLIELFLTRFGPARERRKALEHKVKDVEHILQEGAAQARRMAAPVWNQVVEAVGCGRPLVV